MFVLVETKRSSSQWNPFPVLRPQESEANNRIVRSEWNLSFNRLFQWFFAILWSYVITYDKQLTQINNMKDKNDIYFNNLISQTLSLLCRIQQSTLTSRRCRPAYLLTYKWLSPCSGRINETSPLLKREGGGILREMIHIYLFNSGP